MAQGDIYNVAGTAGNSGNGGPAGTAQLDGVSGIGTDPVGNLYIADAGNNLIQEVTATATSSIPAGTAQASFLSTSATTATAPGGITITQPGGAQVTFYPQNGGSCTTGPYTTSTGQYCVLPQDQGATLTTSSGNHTFTPSPGADAYTYNGAGQLISETDQAGNTLSITYNTPAPGAGDCPSAAASCQTITAASGRALVIGSSSTGLVTSVTDPMGRTWTYGHNSQDQLTSATSPMGHETSYTYGAGTTGNPLLSSDLLTITSPNAQPGGPDAGDATINTYDILGRVTTQTDPAGNKTTLSYCADAATQTCMNTSTGSGFVEVTDPDGNTTVDEYQQGTLTAETKWTGSVGSAETSEQDYAPDTASGTLLDQSTTDGNGYSTAYAFNATGQPPSSTEPSSDGSSTITNAYTSDNQSDCDGSATASAAGITCSQSPGPAAVAPGGVITPPSSAPPEGLTWTQYDTDGNELYTTTGVYEPGSSSAAYSKTTYQLFKGNTVTIDGTTVSCTSTPAVTVAALREDQCRRCRHPAHLRHCG
jgi:YD repeat-containing protein